MRSFIAASVGAIFGFGAVFVLALADASFEDGSLPRGDVAFFLFAFAWCIEALAVVMLSMYRVSPWIARLLLDDWESERIRKAGSRNRRRLEIVCSAAIVLHRIALTLDSGRLTDGTLLALALAALPFIISSPKLKLPNKAPEPTPGSVTPRAIEGTSK